MNYLLYSTNSSKNSIVNSLKDWSSFVNLDCSIALDLSFEEIEFEKELSSFDAYSMDFELGFVKMDKHTDMDTVEL
jgi:hypothetical protein